MGNRSISGMIKFGCILKEYLGHLYRAMGLTELYKILSTNTLYLKFAEGSERNLEGVEKWPFFLSLSRVKYGNFARGGEPAGLDLYSNLIVIVLDAALLRAQHKLRPVDYWHSPSFGSSSGTQHSFARDKEQEERLVSHKDRIPGASKYIKAVHIYVAGDIFVKHSSAHQNRMLFDVEALAKRLGIPIYFYTQGREEAFRSQQTSKATTNLGDILERRDKTRQDQQQDTFDQEWYEKYGSPRQSYSFGEREELKELIKAFLGQSPGSSEKAQSVRYNLKYGYSDIWQHFLNLLHNNRSKNWPEIQQIADLMRRHKLLNMQAFVEATRKKLRSKDL